jgi:hypothetical protein
VHCVLGFFSFTEVTDPGAHEAYNAWHQLDHLPEQFSIDGISFGQRWVCSPPCVQQRIAVSPLLARCHYMTLYLLRDADVLPEFFALARRLQAAGRFFEQRRSHLRGAFEVVGQWSGRGTEVSPAVVPFRPSNGVYVVVGPALGDSRRDDVVAVPGVAGAWEFTQSPEPGSAGGRRITVAFVDGHLATVSDRLGQLWAGGEPGLEWAGPLERVDVGDWGWFR